MAWIFQFLLYFYFIDFPFLKEVIMSSISLCVIGKIEKELLALLFN